MDLFGLHKSALSLPNHSESRYEIFDDGNADNPAIMGWLLIKRVVFIYEKNMYIYIREAGGRLFRRVWGSGPPSEKKV